MDFCGNSRVVCPKPRRPLRFHVRSDVDAFDSTLGAELFDLIRRKEDYEAERCGKVSTSPPFVFGSPPCRAPNPLVQDAKFGVEKPTAACSSPLGSASSSSPPPPPSQAKEKFGKNQATVRVEGFECGNPRFIAMVWAGTLSHYRVALVLLNCGPTRSAISGTILGFLRPDTIVIARDI